MSSGKENEWDEREEDFKEGMKEVEVENKAEENRRQWRE